MVDIAVGGRTVTPGPATRQVPATHEIGERLRGHITEFWGGITGMHQRRKLGSGGQFGHQVWWDQSLRTDLSARRVAQAGQ